MDAFVASDANPRSAGIPWNQPARGRGRRRAGSRAPPRRPSRPACAPRRGGRRRAGRTPRRAAPGRARPALAGAEVHGVDGQADGELPGRVGRADDDVARRAGRAAREAGDEPEVVDHHRGGVVREVGALVEDDLDVPGVERMLVDRSPANWSKSKVNGPMGKVRRSRSGAPTASRASSTASSATRASSALARADFAFHSSHTEGGKSSGVSAPARASSRRRRMMTAADPRCDSTSAIDHSRQ